jgi:protein ImuB
LCADHRPELAFGRLIEDLRCAAGGDESQTLLRECERPLWILQEPRRLSAATLRTLTRDELQARPERIESGWWDGADVRRDYYVVTTCTGGRWWVYRDCVTREWWLHGIFG